MLRRPIRSNDHWTVVEDTLFEASLFIWVVSSSKVSRLFLQTHLRNHRSPQSPTVHSAPHFPRYLFSIVPFSHVRYNFTMEAREQFTKLAIPKMLIPLAWSLWSCIFGRRINRSSSSLYLRLQCFTIPSNTLYIPSNSMFSTCLLGSVISRWRRK